MDVPRTAGTFLGAAMLFITGNVGWDYLNPNLELPANMPSKSESRPATETELQLLTYDKLVPALDGLVTWKPDSTTEFGYQGWLCHDVRDLQGLELLGWRVLTRAYEEGARGRFADYYEKENDFPKGLFLKREMRHALLPFLESERRAMLAELEEKREGVP